MENNHEPDNTPVSGSDPHLRGGAALAQQEPGLISVPRTDALACAGVQLQARYADLLYVSMQRRAVDVHRCCVTCVTSCVKLFCCKVSAPIGLELYLCQTLFRLSAITRVARSLILLGVWCRTLLFVHIFLHRVALEHVHRPHRGTRLHRVRLGSLRPPRAHASAYHNRIEKFGKRA